MAKGGGRRLYGTVKTSYHLSHSLLELEFVYMEVGDTR